MTLPATFRLDDEHGTTVGTGTADERWVVLEMTNGDETGQVVLRPDEFEALRGSLPQFQHITLVPT